MEFTQDQIMAIIGAKEMELISLRIELNKLQSQLKEAQKCPVTEE